MMNPLEDDAYGFHSDSGGGSGAGLSHGDDPLLSPARANSGGGSSSLGGGGITTPPAAAPLAFDTPFADHDHDADLHASATVGGSVFDSTVDGFGRYSSSSSFEQDASGHHDDDEEAGEAEPHRDEDRPRLAPTAGPLTGNPFLQTRQTNPCCNIDRVLINTSKSIFNPLLNSGPLDQQPSPAISIEEAHKTSDGGSSYIVYVIRTNIPSGGLHLESRHRYSDFESLQRLLRKVHPTMVVPPVPDKQSVADYATRPGKAKDDPKLIELRKRMLQSFLNRLLCHPLLSREHILHRFLEPGNSWTEILSSSGLAHYMKKKDKGSGLKITDSLLKNPDPHFLASEDYTYRFGQQLSHIVKYHRKVAKHYADLAVAGSDLGAAYNSWSLMEPHAPNQSIGYASSSNSLGLAHAIESVGEAVDITVSATSQLTQSIELRVTEPLAEYEKLTTAIETILKWRHARHVEYETATEALVAKRAALKKLEAAETESQRLAAVLHSEGVAAPSPRAVDARTAAIAAVSALGLGGAPDQDRRDPASATTSPRPLGSTVAAGGGGSTSSTASAGGGGLLATLNSLMDNDPEATRRAGITRTRDRIQGLEGERERSLTELGAANEAIQRDLDRFQRDKVHDLRNLLLAYAVTMRDHNRKAAAAWADAKEEIARVKVPEDI